MKASRIIVLASALLLISASIILAVCLSGKTIEPKPRISVAKSISEKQPQPTSDLSSDFASIYVAEHKTVENAETEETIIPCFREYELLHENWGCFGLGRDAGSDNTHSIQWDFFEFTVEAFPDPLVREIDDYYYLVYQTDNDTRLFLFSSKEYGNGMFLVGYPIIMKETLSYKDFSEIQVSDSIAKVGSIDSIIPLYYETFELRSEAVYISKKDQGVYFTSIHLLSDGVLQIDYDRKDGDYVVINITFSKEFVLEGDVGDTCYKIFEMDYLA